jgi:hypothetical protein
LAKNESTQSALELLREPTVVTKEEEGTYAKECLLTGPFGARRQSHTERLSIGLIGTYMRFACAVAAGQHAAARDALKVLSAKAPAVKTSAYDYSGILRFLANSPAFAAGRASWIALFTAVQNGDSAGLTAALHQLEPILQQ